MEQTGYVKDIKGERALVKILRDTACGGSCGDCNLCENKEKEEWVINTAGAQKGDTVKIEISTSSALIMSFVAYMVPILIAAVACIFYTKFLSSKTAVDILSFVTLVLAILLTAKSDRLFAKNNRFKSKITEVYKK